ncbi:MAG: MarR family transcriptional regulator [Bacteroidota bacterium]
MNQSVKPHQKIYGSYIDRTYRVIKLHYLKAFREAGLDITTEQWVLIDSLHGQNGLTQKQLAEAIFKNTPTVSRIIDLLSKKGLIERHASPEDRRQNRLFLTKHGKQVHQKALQVVLQLREQGWQNLSEQDYQDFLRIINQVFANFEQE